MTDQESCRWQYWVTPGSSWAENFVQHFFSPDLQMWPEETDAVPSVFAWASPHLNDVASQSELADRTAALKAVFDGAMLLAFGLRYEPFQLMHPTANEASDRAFLRGLQYTGDVRVSPFSQKFIGTRVAPFRDPLDDNVAKSIFLARYDEITCSILKYVGVQGLSNVTLYAFRDWMKGEGWDDGRIAAEAGWSNAKLNNFTNTANNPAYLGPFSRHGGSSQLPRRPMPLDEAIDPMRKAINSFLLERANAVNLQDKWQLITR